MIDDTDPIINVLAFVRNEPTSYDEQLAIVQGLTEEQRKELGKICGLIAHHVEMVEFRERMKPRRLDA